MTQAKKLGRASRGRVRKTGQRAARTSQAQRGAAKAAAPAAPTGGAGDARVRARTGRGLDDWFGALDTFGAVQKGHTAATRHLVEDHGVDGWYAQSITVAYERARGLRSANQRLSGFYDVSVSKVVDAPLPRVASALARPAEHAAWLRGSDPALRRGLQDALSGPGARTVRVRAGRDARLRYPADGSTIEITVLAKPGGRSSVVATVMKIQTAAAKEAHRAAWRRALEGLSAHRAAWRRALEGLSAHLAG